MIRKRPAPGLTPASMDLSPGRPPATGMAAPSTTSATMYPGRSTGPDGDLFPIVSTRSAAHVLPGWVILLVATVVATGCSDAFEPSGEGAPGADTGVGDVDPGADAIDADGSDAAGTDAEGDGDAAPPGDTSDAGDPEAGDGGGPVPTPLDPPNRAGDEVDLGPWVRLDATGTARTILGWSLEQRDGIHAVRDDVASSAFRTHPGDAARVQMDLRPVFRMAPTLETLELAVTGMDRPVRIELASACGGEVLARFEADASAPIELNGQRAGCVVVDVPAGPPFALSAVALRSRDADVVLPTPWSPSRSGEMSRWGIIEGFYGAPWSWRERENLVRRMASRGLGTYVYAPKSDPLHRDDWRGRYDEAFRARFGDLVAVGREHGVRVVFGLSPFIDYGAEEEDAATLLQKLQDMADAGVDGIMLLADDIEEAVRLTVDGALGEVHATTVNALVAALRETRPELVIFFVGTVYSDERMDRWAGGPAYVEALRALDEDVAVLWTGRDTFNRTMEAADLERITEVLGRRPLIWDNLWANDAGDGFTGRVLASAFEGRDEDLYAAVDGIAHNPAIQGALNRLIVSTFGAWVEAAGAPGPEGRLDAAVIDELDFAYGRTPAFDEDALRDAVGMADGNGTRLPTWQRLETLDAAFRDTAPGDVSVEHWNALLETAARAATVRARVLRSSLDIDLVDDLIAPLRRMELDGESLLAAIEAWGRSGDADDEAALRQRARALRDAANRERFRYSGEIVTGLTRALTEDAARPARTWVDAAPTPPCRAGEPFAWTPFGDGPVAGAVGLPDLRVDGATVHGTVPDDGAWPIVVWTFARSESHVLGIQRVDVTCVR